MDKISLEMPKMVNFGEFLKLKLEVKQCYQTGLFLRGLKFIKNAKSSQFWRVFEKLVKLTTFGIFDKLLSNQKVNVARFSRNVE